MLHRISRLLLLPLTTATYVLAQTESQVPPLETIISGMAKARAENRARLRSYKVTRDYSLFGKDRLMTKSEITADITFAPPDLKKYSIQRASGWTFGEKIVRHMLESETHIVKDYSSTDISAANYDLRFLRQEEVNGQHSFVLELRPRRKEENLLRGNIWVDVTTHLPHRMEGEPAKSPSWWLREVRIELVYGEVGGMWLQTASESTVKVRLFGQHTMVSHDVTYEIGEPAAIAGRRIYPLASGLLYGGP